MSDIKRLIERLRAYTELPLEEARTLDPAHYTSPELFELEIEHIWKKEWLCVGHVSELPDAGDFFALQLLDEPMIVVRGADMEIRALTAICRHRWMPIKTHGERGCVNSLQCPYHNWTYGLDGKLMRALHMDANRCFDAAKVRLPEFRLEVWNDLIFVNLDSEASPLAPRLADVEDRLSLFKLPDGWEAAYSYDGIWPVNWKQCVENSELYHGFGLHRETVEPMVPTRNFRPDGSVHGEYWSITIWDQNMENAFAQKQLERSGWRPGDLGMDVPGTGIGIIYPNMLFDFSNSARGWYCLLPLGIDRSRMWSGSAEHGKGIVREWLRDPAASLFTKFNNEDTEAFKQMSAVMRSSQLETGLLSPMEENAFRSHRWTAQKILKAIG